MTSIFRKNPLLFALVWIAIYVVLFSLADSLSDSVDIRSCFSAVLGGAISFLLFRWIRRNELQSYYGLCKVAGGDLKRYLFFIPLIIIASVNLWGGVTIRYPPLETILVFVTMLFVGFIEEVIFRGFLFKAILEKRAKLAIIISSVTFGIGHSVNLLNGAEYWQTFLQIGYAIAIGYLFTILFIKTGSLLPGIFTHGALNAFSVFSGQSTFEQDTVVSVVLILISLGYAAFLKRLPQKTCASDKQHCLDQ
ncbi:CPBP family intramembrane glutamic endopeptidase [Acetobacterium wieringae]|uniref:CPBP family intramembrane glutamic endopeptidase n=1 Tax=Acetobacterium wieringae TaxID=52694 RepID=UPI0026F2DF46|nr:CPBP family intramembrane glutamic endopeptidase [Acetobacterium wieringae]